MQGGFNPGYGGGGGGGHGGPPNAAGRQLYIANVCSPIP
jgi:hypothetical protein